MYSKILAAVAVSLLLTATAAAAPTKPPKDNTPGENGQGGANGFIDKSFEFETVTMTDAQFMGMSNKTPPNEHAAASQGTRTETTTTTTTYTIDVNGPNGQLKDYELADDYEVQPVGDDLPDCANCEIVDVQSSVTEETEVTDLPGANR